MSAGVLNPDSRNRRAAIIAVCVNGALAVLKFIIAALTGSVSLLSEALHSGTDVVASSLALLAVRASSVPPDDEHPYGHGKVENLAGFGEGILLLGIVLFIAAQAINNLTHRQHPQHLELGAGAMALSATASVSLGLYLVRTSKLTGSMALESNGRHMMFDFWTSVAVLVALTIQKTTHIEQADSILALGLSVWLGRSAWQMVREAFEQLIDRRVTDDDLDEIRLILSSEPEVLSYHHLRTRHSGTMHYVEIHVVVPNHWSVVQAHEIADRLESKIEAALAPAQAVIHIDPFDESKL